MEYVISFLGQVLFPLVAIVGSAIGIYMKIAKDTIKWRANIENQVSGLVKDLGTLIHSNIELVAEVKASNSISTKLDAMVTSHHDRLNNYSDRLKILEKDFEVFKAVNASKSE